MGNPVLLNGVESPVSLFETVAGTQNQTHRVGTCGIIDDRVFYWTKFMGGTAIGPNKIAQMAPPVATHVSESQDPIVAGSTVVAFTPGASTDVEQDEYRDGYFKIQDATNGIGQFYKIKAHDVKILSTATTFDLADPVVTTTTGTEIATLVHNPFSHVVIQPTSITAPVAGVTLCNWAAVATASVATPGYLQTAITSAAWVQPRYGWLQTWGLASVLKDNSTLVVGSGVGVGATAGTVGVVVATTVKQRVGVSTEGLATNAVYASIFVMLAH